MTPGAGERLLGESPPLPPASPTIVTASPKTRAWKRRTNAVAAPRSPAASPAIRASSEAANIRQVVREPRRARIARRSNPFGPASPVARVTAHEDPQFRGGIRGSKFLVLVAVAIPLTFAACGDDERLRRRRRRATHPRGFDRRIDHRAGGGGDGRHLRDRVPARSSGSDRGGGVGDVQRRNDGQTVHNLEVEGNGVEEVTDPIEAGASAELTVDLEPGDLRDLLQHRRPRRAGHGGQLTVE